MDDKYELKCQSTDNNMVLDDKKDHVLVPEKKTSGSGIHIETNYSFKDFTKTFLFQILIVIILLFLFYYATTSFFSKNRPILINMKGGTRRLLASLKK